MLNLPRKVHKSLNSYLELVNILTNLNTKKSAGLDGLSPKLLKTAAPVIAGPLTKLFHHCIMSSTSPRQWKFCTLHLSTRKKKHQSLITVHQRPVRNP